MYIKAAHFCLRFFHLGFLAGSLVLADSAGRVHILSGGKRLQISIAEKADAGLYTCVASNVAGVAKKEYNLQVYSKLLISSTSGCRFLLKIFIFSLYFSLEL